MVFAWTLALRYLRSKKSALISIGTLFAILGVTLGVGALATVTSVTGGFMKQFRDKVLGVNAHVLVLKRLPEFFEYREVMQKLAKVKGVEAIAPFVINPMMVSVGDKTQTGVLVKGIDPVMSVKVLDIPKQILDPKTGIAMPEKDACALIASQLRRAHAPAPPTSDNPYEHQAPVPPPRNKAFDPAHNDDDFDQLIQRNEKLRKERVEKELEELASRPKPAPSSSAPSKPFAPEKYNSVLPDDVDEAAMVTSELKKDSEKVKVEDLPGVLVGKSLAKNLRASIGDRLTITSPSGGYGVSSKAPVRKEFRIVGMFEAGFEQYDAKLVYIELSEGQPFYDAGDSVTGVEMRVKNVEDANAIRDEIMKILPKDLYLVMSWFDLNQSLFHALTYQQIAMNIVLALIILVAAFTVIATLIMIVLEKRKEIAVLKALGARDSTVELAFLIQGLLIGAIGTVVGLILGYATSRGLLAYGFPLDPKVYFISKLPVEINPREYALVAIFSMCICLFFSYFPARSAALIRPADGFRDR